MNTNFKKAIPVNNNRARIDALIASGNGGDFAKSLIAQFNKKGTLSDKQWPHVDRLAGEAPRVERIAAFKEQNADVIEWLQANGQNSFADSLWQQLLDRATLSEKQIAAVRRNIEKQEISKPENGASLDNVRALIDGGIESGLKQPRLTVDGFKFSVAPSDGKNAGHLYVKRDGDYIGKIDPDNRFIGRDAEWVKAVAALSLEELKSALITEGKKTGTCCFCSKTLTDDSDGASVDRGYGPTCAERYDLPWGV